MQTGDKKLPASEKLLVKRLTENAILPARASPGAAGYDISSNIRVSIAPYGKAIVSTGIAVTAPPGTYGRLAPRSGFTWNHHTSLEAGVCDRDYTGELKVVLFNHSDATVLIEAGMRIAQLILERVATPEVEEVTDLEPSARGAGGFGSTGST
ncbi:MAG TPA: dUTP diphosphatase [Elusimicrobiota bacterium]|jgi:dUTP pyrophosphatase|nr:dUTP diphosphatase [Elusimicrobiota bacterium]